MEQHTIKLGLHVHNNYSDYTECVYMYEHLSNTFNNCLVERAATYRFCVPSVAVWNFS